MFKKLKDFLLDTNSPVVSEKSKQPPKPAQPPPDIKKGVRADARAKTLEDRIKAAGG